ncbi:MAG: hypothetical protein IKE16_12085, partial [Solobacterium sp.]|nr:hypothetical protein [Solobacterium sp.]
EDFEADEKDLFFQTDHHWLPMTGISACRSIVPWLNENGFPVDQHIYDAENYKIDYSEIPFLGSQGRKVTLAYADLEKMPLVKPLYDSSLTVHLSYGDQTLSGTIEETLLADSYLKETNLYNNSHYNYYGHGSQGLVSIHNNNMHDGSRILVLKESFANCMYPYMPSMAEYIDVIDLRHFDGSLKGFISKNKPEAVIMIYGVQGFFGYRLYGMAENPFYFE